MKHELKTLALFTAASVMLAACSGGSSSDDGPPPLTVPKVASCGGSDKRESALQGQVPAALRQAGFTGFNCNLELVGQYRGEGGNWSAATFRDKAGRACAYHATAAPTTGAGASRNRPTPGVPVIDITNPASPRRTMSLTTQAMLDPWESLRVNERRQLLMADNGQNGGGNAELDIYDISGDCGNPQLLSTTKIGLQQDDTASVRAVVGHEGNVAPDGLTYYIGNTRNGLYHAVDITNTLKPKLLATFDMRSTANPVGAGGPHGLSVSADGNRVYGVVNSRPVQAADVSNPAVLPTNGFIVFDTSEVQARKANPQIKAIGHAVYKDGSTAQHTIPIKIAGKPYVVMVDESGSAGLADAQNNYIKTSCAAGLTPFPLARIFDISDERNPKVVSKLMLETHDPKNCDAVAPDVTGLAVFTYGSHYCSVDNRDNATALACSYFNSGVRVFDIRNPERPREIAYFNPPGATTAVPGSNHHEFGGTNAVGGKPDWCASRLDFDFERKTLTTMCQDNGLIVLRFTNNSWPFAESRASTDQN
jgi:hypothetical protein